MKKFGYLLMFFFAALFSGCDTETEEFKAGENGKTYFPLNIGEYRIYNVSFKRWLQNEVTDSSFFQLRERVDTIYKDISGQATYKIIRSKRLTPNDFWADDSVITVSFKNEQLVRTADNLPLVKMVFPVKENKSWSPNVFNNLDFDTLANGSIAPKPNRASYKNVGQPYTLPKNQFPNTVTVSVNDEESLINVDKKQEVYADNVGLIYLNYRVIEYCTRAPCHTDGDPFDFILNGYERIETLDSYGKLE
jgi:hypothetical protein